MPAGAVATAVLAAAAVALLYAATVRMLKSIVMPALVVAPLALKIPWTKPYPAVHEALVLAATALVLVGWLYARRAAANRMAAFAIVCAAVLVEPQMLVLALAALAVESLRLRSCLGGGRIAKAFGILIACALASVVLQGFVVSPWMALSGFVARMTSGTAWDGRMWVFAGSGGRRMYKLAGTYSPQFWWPLVLPFAALAYRQRKQWWLAPLMCWTATVTALTLLLAREANFHGCPPMEAALLVGFGTVGADFVRSIRCLREPPTDGT